MLLTKRDAHATTQGPAQPVFPNLDRTLVAELSSGVAGADLDGDGKAELIVSAPQRDRYFGQAYIIRGSRISAWRATLPPVPPPTGPSPNVFQLQSGQYQLLSPPGTSNGDVFGWQITIGYMRGNDTLLDIAFFSENGQPPVQGNPCGTACSGNNDSFLGALYYL